MPDPMTLTGCRIVQPEAIERESFAMIEQELRDRLPPDHPRHPDHLSRTERSVLYRVIHTSADFDYVDNLWLSDGVLPASLQILRARPVIVTDTGMAAAGVNKDSLQKLGGEIHCYIADTDVADLARDKGVTRAAVCMDKSLAIAGQGRSLIYAIGNAPTALIQLHELIRSGRLVPDLIIAVPVGFVNVVEAKELIRRLSVPSIIARGRKGGSNVAAAICNALMREALLSQASPSPSIRG